MSTAEGVAMASPSQQTANRLNRDCLCVTLDQEALIRIFEREAGDGIVSAAMLQGRPNLFSPVPVFLPATAIAQMSAIAAAIEATVRLPAYRRAALAWAPPIARQDHGPLGVFMGYDFHLDGDGARLIEINTNAGGAFLNTLLAQSQSACCSEIDLEMAAARASRFGAEVARMFQHEWQCQRGTPSVGRIAIVDDRPEEQYLYPEFLLARQTLRKAGFDVVIADAGALRYREGRLSADGLEIGMVYNRLVDFALDAPEHAALAAAYRDGAAVLTPNPHNHAIFADKRNLTLLSDPAALEAFGLASSQRARLAGIPRTVRITPENADALWQSRKALFFKPNGGHGSKAVYRGDKITRSVWARIAMEGYVAQAFAAPGERAIMLEETAVKRKMDVRLYTYNGQTLLTAVRLYQGQATNFRAAGSGFAPVFPV